MVNGKVDLSFLFEKQADFVGHYSHDYYEIISFLEDWEEKFCPLTAEQEKQNDRLDYLIFKMRRHGPPKIKRFE